MKMKTTSTSSSSCRILKFSFSCYDNFTPTRRDLDGFSLNSSAREAILKAIRHEIVRISAVAQNQADTINSDSRDKALSWRFISVRRRQLSN